MCHCKTGKSKHFTMVWSPFLITFTTSICFVGVRADSAACIAPSPCKCRDENIDCFNLGLTEVPKFIVSLKTYDTLSVDLSNNRITVIPGSAFFNLSTSHPSDIQIDLANNSINKIENSAFNGVKAAIRSLWLQDNNISVLPDALRDVTNLQVLNMRNNPIKEFDTGVFRTFGENLEYLLFGGSASYAWPSDLLYMKKLKSLQFTGYRGNSIPENAFNSFSTTLTGLTIENSHLSSMPTATCSLSVLNFVVFTGNTYTSDIRNFIPSCIKPLATVTSLELSNNELEDFPTVFKTFPNLTSLKVTGNPEIGDIEESVFTNIGLTGLDISNNSLTRIPRALSELKRLPNLFIRQNKIRSIERKHFPNKDIYLLDLSHNPTISVSDDAFDRVSSIITLMLDAVPLTTFPKAVKVLNRLTSISLWDNHLVCNCKMSWILSEWPYHNRVAITGNCSNIPMTLYSYIAEQLPLCP